MKAKILSMLAGVSLIFGLAAGAVAETIEVDRADFEFKVPDEQSSLFGTDDGQGKMFFYTAGKAEAKVKVKTEGEYVVTINASCTAAEKENAKFKLSVDGKEVGEETQLKSEDADDYKFTVKLTAGEHKLGIEFTNDKYKEGEYDLNFFVHSVTLKSK